MPCSARCPPHWSRSAFIRGGVVNGYPTLTLPRRSSVCGPTTSALVRPRSHPPRGGGEERHPAPSGIRIARPPRPQQGGSAAPKSRWSPNGPPFTGERPCVRISGGHENSPVLVHVQRDARPHRYGAASARAATESFRSQHSEALGHGTTTRAEIRYSGCELLRCSPQATSADAAPGATGS